MSIETKIFSRKRFQPEAMLRFGFERSGTNYTYQADLVHGDFTAILSVSAQNEIVGSVIDKQTGEEYVGLRVESFSGTYVETVRREYEELLRRICACCCTDELFTSNQANRIVKAVCSVYGVHPDFPFGGEDVRNYGVFRHSDNNKWFALMMNIKRRSLFKNNDERTIDVLNLKAPPEEIDILTQTDGIYYAYHMNHRHWITVTLDGKLTDKEIMNLIDVSYELTKRKRVKKS